MIYYIIHPYGGFRIKNGFTQEFTYEEARTELKPREQLILAPKEVNDARKSSTGIPGNNR